MSLQFRDGQKVKVIKDTSITNAFVAAGEIWQVVYADASASKDKGYYTYTLKRINPNGIGHEQVRWIPHVSLELIS